MLLDVTRELVVQGRLFWGNFCPGRFSGGWRGIFPRGFVRGSLSGRGRFPVEVFVRRG